MNTAIARAVVNYEMDDFCIDRLLQKARVSQRRKEKFGEENGHNIRRRHWYNHAGTYKDVLLKAPKYYHSSLQPRIHNHIRDYQDLVTAIRNIAAGKSNHDHYNTTSSLTRERLRYTQSQRDKGKEIKPNGIARMGYEQMKI